MVLPNNNNYILQDGGDDDDDNDEYARLSDMDPCISQRIYQLQEFGMHAKTHTYLLYILHIHVYVLGFFLHKMKLFISDYCNYTESERSKL